MVQSGFTTLPATLPPSLAAVIATDASEGMLPSADTPPPEAATTADTAVPAAAAAGLPAQSNTRRESSGGRCVVFADQQEVPTPLISDVFETFAPEEYDRKNPTLNIAANVMLMEIEREESDMKLGKPRRNVLLRVWV